MASREPFMTGTDSVMCFVICKNLTVRERQRQYANSKVFAYWKLPEKRVNKDTCFLSLLLSILTE